MDLLWFLLVGLIAGWLGGTIMKGGGFGMAGDIVVGVIGSFVGGFVFRALGLSSGGGLVGSLVVATVGAIILIWLVRLIK